jgi:uncharacterized pyridoxamine 5'-phosphate oxidase family protein
MLEKGGKLFFCTSNKKQIYQELSRDPNVELCGSSGDGAWIRISGTVRFVDDGEVKQRIFAVSPLVASIYEDPHNNDFETFCLDDVVAVIDELGGKPPRRYEM